MRQVTHGKNIKYSGVSDSFERSLVAPRPKRNKHQTRKRASAPAQRMYIPDAMSTEGCGSHHDLCSTYCDEEVDRALATIDAAWPNCFPDHIDDAKKLKKKSHQAVKTLRQFRGEVLSWTKEAIGHGDTDLLAPGEGPATLLKSLGRVSEYMEAKSRKVVEDARREVIQHFFEFGVWPETQQRSAGKPLTYSRLSKELQKSVRLHVEPVIDAAEVCLYLFMSFDTGRLFCFPPKRYPARSEFWFSH